MAIYEITLAYSKEVEVESAEDAQKIIDDIERQSTLNDVYGPFDAIDVWTAVKKIED